MNNLKEIAISRKFEQVSLNDDVFTCEYVNNRCNKILASVECNFSWGVNSKQIYEQENVRGVDWFYLAFWREEPQWNRYNIVFATTQDSNDFIELDTRFHYIYVNNGSERGELHNSTIYTATDDDDVRYVLYELNCPLYADEETARAHLHDYIDNGDWNGSIVPKPKFKADWKITKIGTQNIITHSICDMSELVDNPESDFYQKGNQISYTYIASYVTTTTETGEIRETHNYTDIVKYSYADIVSSIDTDFWEKIINGLNSLIEGKNIEVRLYAYYDDGETQLGSGGAYFRLGNSSIEVDVFPNSNDTIKIITEEEEEDGDYDDGDEIEDEDNLPSGADLLTKTYALTREVLQSIGQQLWGSTFIENIHLVNNSPIENIISAKLFPFALSGGSSGEIKIGNVEMGQSGEVMSSSHIVLGEFTVNVPESNAIPRFLNYGNFTTIQIYIPYVGIQTLDTNKVMGRTIKLRTTCDIITGACEHTLKVSYGKNYVPISVYRCNVGEEIPITASNRASVEVGYITSAIGTMSDIAAGNYVGAITNSISGASQKFHSNTQGSASPSVSAMNYLQPFIIVSYPKTNISEEFKNTYGYACNRYLRLSRLSGFTQIDKPHITNIQCSQEERNELISIMQRGFYL